MSLANLLGSFIFGCVGLAAFVYGKKQTSFKAMVIGIALMAYPYFVSNTIALYVIGISLIALLFILRDY